MLHTDSHHCLHYGGAVEPLSCWSYTNLGPDPKLIKINGKAYRDGESQPQRACSLDEDVMHQVGVADNKEDEEKRHV